MLKLYHGNTSVCSIKARVALAEKGLKWDGELLNLQKGDQFAPEYRALNPEAVVPTLVHDGLVVRESSVIIDYVDMLTPDNPLMPADRAKMAVTKLWLVRCIEIHAAINTMTFATVFREKQTEGKTEEEIEAFLANLPNRQIAAKRRDLFAHGTESVYVDGALHTLDLMLSDMHAALEHGPWLTGEAYGLADVALIGYVDRLERLGMAGMWSTRFPRAGEWLERSRARKSYETEVIAYIPEALSAETRAAGERGWPAIARRLS